MSEHNLTAVTWFEPGEAPRGPHGAMLEVSALQLNRLVVLRVEDRAHGKPDRAVEIFLSVGAAEQLQEQITQQLIDLGVVATGPNPWTDYVLHVQKKLRYHGLCIDGMECHQGCRADGECLRQERGDPPHHDSGLSPQWGLELLPDLRDLGPEASR